MLGIVDAGAGYGWDTGATGDGHPESTPAAADVHLKFWTFSDYATGTAKDLLTTFLGEFEDAHPGVTVELIGKPGPDIVSGIVATSGTSESPDVVTSGLDTGGQLVAAGALKDLSAQWNASAADYRDQFDPSFVSVLGRDGHVWGVPFSAYATVLFRNLTVLDESGVDPAAPIADWADWKTAMDKVQAAGFVALPDYLFGQWQFMSFYGGTADASFALSDDGHSTTLDAGNLSQTLEYLVSIQPATVNIDPTDQAAVDLFTSNEMAYLVGGPWMDPTFQEATTSGLEYDVVPVPGVQAGATGGVRGGEYLGVPSSSANPDLAWELVEYLSDAAQTAQFASGLGRLVANDVALADPAVKSNELVQTTAAAFKSSADEVPLMRDMPSDFLNAFGDVLTAVDRGEMAPADGGQKIVDGLNALLE